MASAGSACPPACWDPSTSPHPPIKILNHTLYLSLGHATSHWLPGGLLMAEHPPLSLTILPILYSINHPLIEALVHQLGFDNITANCQRSFKGHRIQHPLLSLIQSQGSNHVGQGWFVCGRSVLDDQITFLSVLCLDSPLQGLRLSWLTCRSSDPPSGSTWKWMKHLPFLHHQNSLLMVMAFQR